MLALRLALLLLLLPLLPAPVPLLAQAEPGSGDAASLRPTGAASGDAAREVRRAFNLLVSAANRLDADAEGAFFWRSPLLVSVAQATPTLGWEARQRNTRHWYGALARQEIRIRELELRDLAPDAVALTASYDQEIEAKDGRSWTGPGVWSLVYRREGGEWRIVYEHYSYER